MAGPDVRAGEWGDFYLEAIENLQPGITEMIVHLGHDDAELQGITVNHPDYGAAWRQRDYEFFTSPRFARAVQDNHIIVVKWKDLQRLVNQP